MLNLFAIHFNNEELLPDTLIRFIQDNLHMVCTKKKEVKKHVFTKKSKMIEMFSRRIGIIQGTHYANTVLIGLRVHELLAKM